MIDLPRRDRLFATYRVQPEAGHEKMAIGLKEYKDIKITNRIDGMLLMPFKK